MPHIATSVTKVLKCIKWKSIKIPNSEQIDCSITVIRLFASFRKAQKYFYLPLIWISLQAVLTDANNNIFLTASLSPSEAMHFTTCLRETRICDSVWHYPKLCVVVEYWNFDIYCSIILEDGPLKFRSPCRDVFNNAHCLCRKSRSRESAECLTMMQKAAFLTILLFLHL